MKKFSEYLKMIQNEMLDWSVNDNPKLIATNKFLDTNDEKKLISFLQFLPSKNFDGNTSTGNKNEINNFKNEIKEIFIILKKLIENKGTTITLIYGITELLEEQIKKNKNKFFISDIKEDFIKELENFRKNAGQKKDKFV